MTDAKPSWRFPYTFWIANAVELCERAAYYGTFIALRTYLLRVVGLDDVQAGFLAGIFSALIYLFPFFTGAAADRIGFRGSLILAFLLLTVGYGSRGVFHTLNPCGYNRCDETMEFHHIDPSQKNRSFGNLRSNPKRIEILIEELQKCILLCSNCHKEIHAGKTQMPTSFTLLDESIMWRDYRRKKYAGG